MLNSFKATHGQLNLFHNAIFLVLTFPHIKNSCDYNKDEPYAK